MDLRFFHRRARSAFSLVSVVLMAAGRNPQEVWTDHDPNETVFPGMRAPHRGFMLVTGWKAVPWN